MLCIKQLAAGCLCQRQPQCQYSVTNWKVCLLLLFYIVFKHICCLQGVLFCSIYYITELCSNLSKRVWMSYNKLLSVKSEVKMSGSVCLSESRLCLSFRVSDWHYSHCDYLQPFVRIQDFGCKYLNASECMRWGEANSLAIKREARRDSPLCQCSPGVIASTVLLKMTQITAHWFILHPLHFPHKYHHAALCLCCPLNTWLDGQTGLTPNVWGKAHLVNL